MDKGEEVKPIGTPQADNDPLFLICLASNLEPDESVSICKKCGCHYLTTYLYKEVTCIFCSNKRTSVGSKAKERNRAYGRKHAKKI